MTPEQIKELARLKAHKPSRPEQQPFLDKLNEWRVLTRDEQRQIMDTLLEKLETDKAQGPGPSVIKKAASAARATVGFIKDRGRMAPQDVQDARKAICQACPHFDAARDVCKVCGCYLKIKRSIASSECPLDPPKWEAV